MSNKALNWGWEARVPAAAKLLLLALADHAGDHAGEDWTCWPSADRLIDFTGYPKRTLERHMAWLVQAGWVTVQAPRSVRGKMQVRRYTLHRDEETRMALAAERGGAVEGAVEGAGAGLGEGSETGLKEGHPPANMAGGETGQPPAKNPAVHPPESTPPPANLAGGYIDEPPRTLKNPHKAREQGASAGAGEQGGGQAPEPTVDWKAMGWLSMPQASRAVTSERLFGGAWDVEVGGGADPQAMAAACLAYSRDTGSWGASGRPVGATKFLAEGRWRQFAGADGARAGTGGGAALAVTVPAEVFEAVAGVKDDGFARSWLSRAVWDDGERVLSVPELPMSKLRAYGADRALAAINITLKERAS